MKRVTGISILAATAAAAYLAGCGQKPTERVEEGTSIIVGEGMRALVREVKLEDGTRCAIMWGEGRGGITCDWEGSRKP